MKNELDSFMQSGDIDALWIIGPGQHNPALVYLTGGAHLTTADLIKKRGETPMLFHGPMERDEAAKSGLSIRSYSNYPMREILKQAGGDKFQFLLLRYKRMFEDLNLKAGNVMMYGQTDLGLGYALVDGLQKLVPEINFIGYQEEDILSQVMFTKDDEEISRIRQMGQVTVDVVSRVAEFLTGHRVIEEVLVKENGSPLKIGEVKNLINLWLAELGVENPKGTVFSIGSDAGVPHSTGNPDDVLRLGQSIVFDIFPCESNGGYFHDFTRTWCLGYATDEVQKAYDQVYSVYQKIVSELKVNERFSKYQSRTCELFEEFGHPTVKSNPETEAGYVHSLGHGLGLHVHERPFCGASASEKDVLAARTVFTIEPGLYYPDRGFGVRLENTMWVSPTGQFEVLADYPMDLVLPMRKND